MNSRLVADALVENLFSEYLVVIRNERTKELGVTRNNFKISRNHSHVNGLQGINQIQLQE